MNATIAKPLPPMRIDSGPPTDLLSVGATSNVASAVSPHVRQRRPGLVRYRPIGKTLVHAFQGCVE
jgi:hypothetical protein